MSLFRRNKKGNIPENTASEDKSKDSVTLYTATGNVDAVKDSLLHQFAEMTREVAALPNPDASFCLSLHLHNNAIVILSIISDHKYVSEQIAGMTDFFAQANCRNTELHHSVLNQIRVFNCIIGCFYEYDDEASAADVLDLLYGAAKTINALVLTKRMELFNHEHKLVLSIEGQTDLDTYTPIANADLLDGGAEETDADRMRRERSMAVLQEKGIPHLPGLHAAVKESEARIRSAAEIVDRLLAMFAVCVYCEARSNGGSLEEPHKYLKRIDEILTGNLKSCLTPEETAFLNVKNPDGLMYARFGWRYECCHVLMWVLGLTDELGYPDKICNVSDMAAILWNVKSANDLFDNAKARQAEDILDAADLVLRYDWACVDARIHKEQSPAGLNGEVVYEWHYAFNWLTGANNNADWDRVSVDT